VTRIGHRGNYRPPHVVCKVRRNFTVECPPPVSEDLIL
jgi:hypothetical protein